jgi:hypothetical protein
MRGPRLLDVLRGALVPNDERLNLCDLPVVDLQANGDEHPRAVFVHAFSSRSVPMNAT